MKLYIFLFLLITITELQAQQPIRVGADQIEQFDNQLQNKRVALVINQTSVLSNGIHLLDTLLTKNVNIIKIFTPEHGFRGDGDAGESISDGKDVNTGIPVVSLYGKHNKPSPQQLANVDIVVFDIQDVGTRFYTYISTMHYVMEACAENNKECLILDRPNPNDHIDGPVLNLKYRSFVGMHPIPLLHGLTIGELATMINYEGWLKDKIKCLLYVIPVQNWEHGQHYPLPVKPSPNLPNCHAIALYPSLCFFEATQISVARGTAFPFEAIGAPENRYGKFMFIPRITNGAKYPMHKNIRCYGEDLRRVKTDGSLDLQYLIRFYKNSAKGASFFSSSQFMDLLSGSNKLRLQILRNESEKKIRESWQEELNAYKKTRKKYLLYADKRE